MDGPPVAGRVKKIAIDYHPNYSMHCSLMEIIQQNNIRIPLPQHQ